MLDKTFEEISIEDIRSLIENETQENKIIEFKLILSLSTGDEKREFLSDISSFANSGGGFLIYGLSESRGIAKDLIGFEIENTDAELLKIENLLRDNIEPRITGIQIKTLKLENNKYLLVFKIPQSYNRPHVVKYGGYFKFFSRNSSGKYPLNVTELRDLFQSSANTIEKLKAIRLQKINSVISNETPIELESEKDGRFIVHIIPLSSIVANISYDLKVVKNKNEFIRPMRSQGWNYRLNFDGVFTYSSMRNLSKAYSYNQFLRNGIIEAVDCSIMEIQDQHNDYGIWGSAIRRETNQLLSQAFELYKLLDISPPVYVLMSFLKASDYYILADPTRFVWQEKRKIGKDTLFIPEIVFENFENINETMSFAYDCFWNAGGWERAME